MTDEKIFIEFLGPTPLYIGMGIKIITSMLLGGLIGLDREKKLKAAGIKTNILICIGATLYTSVSLLFAVTGQSADANRVTAQVVSGIGFLGAGAIMRDNGGIVGLTTAALIWVVAAIGVTVGHGFPFVATLFTLSFMFVLKILPPLYRIFDIERKYKITIHSRGSILHEVQKICENFNENKIKFEEKILEEGQDYRVIVIDLVFHPKRMKVLLSEIEILARVEKPNTEEISN